MQLARSWPRQASKDVQVVFAADEERAAARFAGVLLGSQWKRKSYESKLGGVAAAQKRARSENDLRKTLAACKTLARMSFGISQENSPKEQIAGTHTYHIHPNSSDLSSRHFQRSRRLATRVRSNQESG